MRSLKELARFQVSLREMLLFLFFLLLAPVLAVQAGIYYKWFQTRRNTEILANLEIARVLRASFSENLRNLVRQELSIGKSLTALRNLSRKEANEFLAMTAAEYPYLHSILWASPSGEFVAGSDRRAIGIKIADREFFQAIVAGKEWVVSDLYPVGRVTGKMFFIVARGIRDANGGLLGVVLASVDPQKLGELLFSVDRPTEGIISVFDSKGSLVYSRPDSSHIGRNYRDTLPILDQALRNKEDQTGSYVFPDTEGKRVSAMVPLRDIGWTISASRPENEILAPILRSLVYAVELNLLAIVAFGILTLAISHRLVRSVRTLHDCAHNIGEGEFRACPPVSGPHEIVQLRNAINQMMEQIQFRKEEAERILKELDRSNKELERFAYIASHDLQEPLRMVAGFLQLLQRRYHGKLDAEADEYINYAVDGAARMKNLINDLLVFSRLNSKTKGFETINCDALLDRVLDNLRPTVARSGAIIKRDALPAIPGDSTQLAQVFQNLIANAIKFKRPSVPPEVHISAVHTNGEWIFSVRDNGIGIPSQHFERIFVIFQRLHDQSEVPGTGLGLAICKKVIERHGGRIWVESEVNKGSVFYFGIPDTRMGDAS